MADFLEKSIEEFTRELASRSPTPGGGGASALAGALGAALASMVGELTAGKKSSAGEAAEVRSLTEKAQELSRRLLDCVEKDAEAFAPLARAYAIPWDDPGREAVMEECLRRAAGAPLEILELCCEGIKLHRALSEKSSALALSDVGSGVVLCWGAMYAAAMNVRVNTHAMKDREYASALNHRVDSLMSEHWKIADGVYEDIYRRLG